MGGFPLHATEAVLGHMLTSHPSFPLLPPVRQVLEMLSYLTYYGQSISERLWSLWPQIETAVNEWAFDYWENILVRVSLMHVHMCGKGQRGSRGGDHRMKELVCTDNGWL